MPYDIKRNYGGCKGYAVVGPEGSKGCHSSRKKAIEQQRALYAAESQAKKSDEGVITNEDVPQPYPEDVDKQSPCWDGYVQRGMKPGKGGRMVPNCVPVKKRIVDQIRSLF